MKKRAQILFYILIVLILCPLVFSQKEGYNSTEDTNKIVSTSEKEGISQDIIPNCDSYLEECSSGRQEACLKYDYNCNPKFESPKENLEIKEGKVIYEGIEVKSSPSEIIKEVNNKFGSVDKINLVKEKNAVQYEVTSQKEGKILNTIKVDYKVKYIYDKEGNYEGKEQPWWSFLIFEKSQKIITEIQVGNCFDASNSKNNGEEIDIYVELNDNVLYFEHNLSTYCNFADIVALDSEVVGNTLKITEKIGQSSPLAKCICLIPVNGTIILPQGTNISRVNITLLNEVVDEETFLGSVLINNQTNNQLCKELIYKGNPNSKINILFISNYSNETYADNVLLDFFSKNNDISFYSVYPFNETESVFNFYHLNIYNISTQYATIEDLLLAECSDLAPFIHQVLFVSGELLPWAVPKSALGNYLNSSNRVYNQYIMTPDKTSLGMFLHEFGHSFFGFHEGYGLGFGLQEESYNIDYYKINYNNTAEQINWDIEGCPKWCSGQINTSSICYPDYIILKNCLLSPQTDTNNKANSCVSSFFDNLYNNFGLGQPVDCNFGINCSENSNCWFIGNGFFRPNAKDIMFGGVDFNEDKLLTYGPFNKHMADVINLISQSTSNNRNYEFKIINLSIIPSIYLNTGHLFFKFNGIDEDGQPLAFFNDPILGNNFFVSYEIENDDNTIYGNITSFIRRDTNGTYSGRDLINKGGEGNYISIENLNFPFTIKLTFYYLFEEEIKKGQEFYYLVEDFGKIA